MTTSLPIETIRSDVESCIHRNEWMIVTAETGSGKSTRIPQWMSQTLQKPILVVEPRRIACRSLASYLSRTREEPVGVSVGYTIQFENRTGPDTQIVFATPGVVLRMLQQNSAFPFGGVILDEFHERNWETDVIATLLRSRRNDGTLRIPVIVTSATIDAKRLQKKFNISLMHAEGRNFPVRIEYHEEPAAPSMESLSERVASALREICSRNQQGDVLVFLPGKKEIEGCYRYLSENFEREPLELFRVHGSLSTQEISDTYDFVSKRRKIYLSTNVSETSITLPNIHYVVDSGLLRTKIHQKGHSALAVVRSNEGSLRQRAGRAGRVAPGCCIRIFSARYQPEKEGQPEIGRIDLDDLVLQSAAGGLNINDIALAPWPSAPPDFAINAAAERLSHRGLVDKSGVLTDKGREFARMPVSAEHASMLFETPPHLVDTIADLVAHIQRPSALLNPLHHLPKGEREDVEFARTTFFTECTNEVSMVLKCIACGDANELHLNKNTLRDTRARAQHIRRWLSDRRERVEGTLPVMDELITFLLMRVPEKAYALRQRSEKKRKGNPEGAQPWANGQQELWVTPFLKPGYTHEAKPSAPVAGLVLSEFWIGETYGQKVRGIGRLLLPCTAEQLLKAGLGQRRITDAKVVKIENTYRVEARSVIEFAGRELSQSTQELSGADALPWMARSILGGQMYARIGDRIHEDFHIWRVLHEVGLSDPQGREVEPLKFSSAEAYLEHVFLDIGIESPSDLELVEENELWPKMVNGFGLYDDEREKLLKEFPLTWSHQGASYTIKVLEKGKLIQLEPANASAKKGGDPPKEFLPRFRGARVVYQKASRRVRLR